MKKLKIIWVMVVAFVLNIIPVSGQSESQKKEIIADSNTAKKEFIEKDAMMKGIFGKAYGYVIFPNVGKGGLMYEASVGGQKFKFKKL